MPSHPQQQDPGTPVLRDADDRHLEGICWIYNQAVRETDSIWSETPTTLEQRRAWMQGRRNAGFPVIVATPAEDPAHVFGYAAYGVFRDFPGYVRTVEHSVYVRPDAQRMGLGRSLLNELINQARSAGMESMVGGIDSQNAASLALHEALGFERQGCLRGVGRKFNRRLDLVFMVRSLQCDPDDLTRP